MAEGPDSVEFMVTLSAVSLKGLILNNSLCITYFLPLRLKRMPSVPVKGSISEQALKARRKTVVSRNSFFMIFAVGTANIHRNRDFFVSLYHEDTIPHFFDVGFAIDVVLRKYGL